MLGCAIFCSNTDLLGCHTLHKKWSFSLRNSSVNVTKSAGNYGFGFTEETIDLLKKSLTENFIFYAVHNAYLLKTCSSESIRQED